MKNFLKNGVLPVGAYCPPQTPCGDYPNRITEQQYKLVKDAGIDVIFAHSEVMNSPTESFAFLSLEIAEKTGLTVYVKDDIAKEYVALGDKGDKAYPALSESEKAELDERFEKSLKRYCFYKAFGGISFWDEPGFDSFDGIARAKRVFDRVCPDKTFYVNMYPYYITPAQYQFGYWCNAEKVKPTDPHFAVVEGGRNIDRYAYLYENYIKKVNLDFFSYDAYPFCDFDEVTTSVHEVLWEIPQFLHAREKENGIPFWVYLQAGGKWEGRKNVRVPTFSEMSLGVGVPLLYGAKGLQVFPYAYPNDWLSDHVTEAGLTDRYGNATRIYHDYKKIISYVKAMQTELLSSELTGIIKTGKYNNRLPDKEELSKVKWSECIYQGNLPPRDNIEVDSCEGADSIESDGECLTGVLSVNGKDGFFIVNDSTTDPANYKIRFKRKGSYLIVKEGIRTIKTIDGLSLILEAGEFVLIVGM